MLSMIFDTRFGAFLRNYREDLQISLRQLAKDTGLDPAYLSRVERELSPAPRPEMINQIADTLCRNQGLSTVDCERLKRQLLEAAGQLPKDNDLIGDLSNRFADKLRDVQIPETEIHAGLETATLDELRKVLSGKFEDKLRDMKMPEAYVRDALEKVTWDDMRKVLSGEEPLEIRWFHEVSAEEKETRRSRGEKLFTLTGQAETESDRKQKDKKAGPAYKTKENATSASAYIKEHASEFTSTAKPRSRRQDRPSGNRFTAGNRAHIEVQGELTSNQQKQLRTISQLIKSILEEK